jgi:hypothetical protein
VKGISGNISKYSNTGLRHGDRSAGVLKALQKIGTSCLADHFKEIIDLFPAGNIPSGPEERKRILDTWQYAEEVKLTDFSECFNAMCYPDLKAVCRENLDEALSKYIHNNRSIID